MKVNEFREILRAEGRYDTPENPCRGAADRILGRFDAWYKLRVLQIVAATSCRMRHSTFTQESWGPRTYAVWRAVEGCGGRISVRGLQHLRNLDGPAVIVSNHMSMIETVILPSILLPFRMITMVVKQSLLDYPVFGATMRAVRPIAVTRTDPRADLRHVMMEGERCLKEEGRSVIVFPQATREASFHPASFGSLGAKLAHRAGVPLLPLALKTDFHGIGRWVRDFGPVDRSKRLWFEFGPAIDPETPDKQAHRESLAFIEGRLREWGVDIKS